MSKPNLQLILREELLEALLEDEGGSYQTYDGMSFYDDTPAGYGGGGGGEGGQTVLGMFGQPLADIGRTAMWGLQYLSTKILYFIPALVGSWFAGMIPYLEGSDGTASGDVFNTIREKENAALDKLDQKYHEVLKTNMSVLQSNDVWGLAFLLNPSVVIGEKLVEHAPEVAFSILNAATGGLAARAAQSIRHALREQPEGNIKEQVKKLLADQQFMNTFNNSAAVKSGQQAAEQILVSRAAPVLSAKSFEDLQRATGKDLTTGSSQVLSKAQIPAQNIEQAKPALLKLVKDEFRKRYVAGLHKMSSPQSSSVINQAISNLSSIQ